MTVWFFAEGTPDSWLLNPNIGSAVFTFTGTTTYWVDESGTWARAMTVGPIMPGTYDITADFSTTLLNVRRGVYIE